MILAGLSSWYLHGYWGMVVEMMSLMFMDGGCERDFSG